MDSKDDELQLSFRPAEERDLETVLALYRHLNPNDPPLDPEGEAREIWSALRGSDLAQCLVGEVEGVVAATCILVVVPNLTRGGRPYALIENVATDPGYRRRGIGTRLLHHAIERAWAQRCYKVMLMTSRQDEAILRFYEQAGFDSQEKRAFVARARPDTAGTDSGA